MNEVFESFNKEKMNDYFRELGKELRKQLGKNANIELVIVGGASIVLNYDFRDSTLDIDAFISTHNSIKEVINKVGDNHNLPANWLNQDFVKTNSFSPKIVEASQYYRTFSNVLTVRTVAAEYLIAMKLASFRPYKYDNSDIIGIISEHQNAKNPLTLSSVTKAVIKLYGSWDNISDKAIEFIQNAFNIEDLDKTYNIIKEQEMNNKELLLDFDSIYPNVLNDDNLDEILKHLSGKDGQP